MSSGEIPTVTNPKPFVPQVGDIVFWVNSDNERRRYCRVHSTDCVIENGERVYKVWGQWRDSLKDARLAKDDHISQSWIEHDKCHLLSSCKKIDLLWKVQDSIVGALPC